jgi:hypothetical protein
LGNNASSWEIAGSIPDKLIHYWYFKRVKSFQIHYGSGIDSASLNLPGARHVGSA